MNTVVYMGTGIENVSFLSVFQWFLGSLATSKALLAKPIHLNLMKMQILSDQAKP